MNRNLKLKQTEIIEERITIRIRCNLKKNNVDERPVLPFEEKYKIQKKR